MNKSFLAKLFRPVSLINTCHVVMGYILAAWSSKQQWIIWHVLCKEFWKLCLGQLINTYYIRTRKGATCVLSYDQTNLRLFTNCMSFIPLSAKLDSFVIIEKYQNMQSTKQQ